MTTFAPKLYFSKEQARQIPVWEIRDEKGERVYFERQKKAGLIPVGCREVYQQGGTTVVVCDVVSDFGHKKPYIFSQRDGYYAPSSWYEKDPFVSGSRSNHKGQSQLLGSPAYESADEMDVDEQ